jgi:proteasome lid subunit RPN8/RPN11
MKTLHIDILHILRCYDLRKFGDRRYRRERVAILTSGGRVFEVDNEHEDPRSHFRVSVGTAKALVQSLDRIWAVLHTHPYPHPESPSADDLSHIADGLLGIVYHVPTRHMTVYRKDEVLTWMKDER